MSRFIQPDTDIPDPGSSQSLNRYSYVRNNPLNATDPSGHFDLQGPGDGATDGSDTFNYSVNPYLFPQTTPPSSFVPSTVPVSPSVNYADSINSYINSNWAGDASPGGISPLVPDWGLSIPPFFGMVPAIPRDELHFSPDFKGYLETNNSLLGKALYEYGNVVLWQMQAGDDILKAASAPNGADGNALPLLPLLWPEIRLFPESTAVEVEAAGTAAAKETGGFTYGELRKSGLNLTDQMSPNQLAKLTQSIKENGLENKVINFVKIADENYVVLGNNRLQVAQKLGITDQLVFKQVQLPFRGFKTENDVINAFAERAGGH